MGRILNITYREVRSCLLPLSRFAPNFRYRLPVFQPGLTDTPPRPSQSCFGGAGKELRLEPSIQVVWWSILANHTRIGYT